jgi:diacylglycerol kinase (ATP)
MMADPTPQAAAPVYPRVECKSIVVIVNPAAGQDKPFLQTMNTAFRNAGIDWDLRITKEAGDATRLAQEAVAAGVDVVGAYGGDGTVGEVAAALQGTDVPLAIFPGGTANVMSVELGIPADLGLAAALVCGNGLLRPVDMGRIGDRRFMLRATVGFSAEMTKITEREDKNRLGNLAYILSAIKLLPDAHSVPYKLVLDGETVEAPGTICFVANSGSMGIPGLTLNNKMDISDGLLDVVLIEAERIGAILSLAANAAGLSEPVHHWQVREVTVSAEPSQTVEVDGEVIDPTPLTASVIPQAIKVIVPPTPANGGSTPT